MVTDGFLEGKFLETGVLLSYRFVVSSTENSFGAGGDGTGPPGSVLLGVGVVFTGWRQQVKSQCLVDCQRCCGRRAFPPPFFSSCALAEMCRLVRGSLWCVSSPFQSCCSLSECCNSVGQVRVRDLVSAERACGWSHGPLAQAVAFESLSVQSLLFARDFTLSEFLVEFFLVLFSDYSSSVYVEN